MYCYHHYCRSFRLDYAIEHTGRQATDCIMHNTLASSQEKALYFDPLPEVSGLHAQHYRFHNHQTILLNYELPNEQHRLMQKAQAAFV